METKQQLTAFQEDFINDIVYFTRTKGAYQFYKTSVDKQYEDYLTPEQITKEIQELIDGGLIEKSSKKVLYNGRFSTRVVLVPITEDDGLPF